MLYNRSLIQVSLKIREGFIVDEDEEEEGEDSDAQERIVKRKREHRDREEEEQLDEDDLELIGEQIERRAPTQVGAYQHAPPHSLLTAT